MITTVIFDLDGLLADTERLHRQAYQEALAHRGALVTDEQYSEHWIRAGKSIADWIRAHELDLDAEAVRKHKMEIYRELLDTSLEPMEGALPALERLKSSKILGLASSSYERDVRHVLARLEITDCFRVIATGNHVSRTKPSPEIFLYTASELGVAPRDCVVIEDAEKGIVAAHHAGMRSIAIPTECTQSNDFSKATRILGSLHELTVDLLDDL